MKLAPRKPTLLMMLTVALLVMLPVLAVMQYRWMGQVSEGERERLQKNLREGAAKFTQDFDREIARLFFSFQVAAFPQAQSPGEEVAQCYARWRQEAAFPGLVKDIYTVRADASGGIELRRFNRATSQLEAAAWTPALQGLQARLERRMRELPAKFQIPLSDVSPSVTVKPDFLRVIRDEIEPIAADIPALILHRIPARLGGELTALPLHAVDYTILALDLDFIRTEVVPRLAAAYFSGDNGLDYNLTLVSRREPAGVIYQSDNAPLDPRQPTDATANLFNIRFNEVNTIVRQREQEVISAEKEPKKAVAIQVFRGDTITRTDGSSTSSLFAAEGGAWQLLLKHRAGSLDAVVSSARRRNLAISFGILLLLAISVGMILVSTRRAERLANQQMEFVAGVSHELRTPLAVIRSAGENLADGVIEEGAQVRRYGSLIAGEGRRLTEMVEQILEFSGIQSGRKSYTLRPTDARDVIEKAVAACLPTAEEGGFEITQKIAPDLPQVAADEAALSRSLQNLLTNAMKYSGDSRAVEISATPTDGRAPNSGVQITVADCGVGIDAEDLPHIFEPFYRGREATEAQIHGSGLGLSLVKQIVEAHGGRVTVSSSKGQGSAFTIHLKSLESPESLESLESPRLSENLPV